MGWGKRADAAYGGGTELAEFAPGVEAARSAPTAGEAEPPLDQAVTAGLVTLSVFLWALTLLLAMGWLAGLFLAALPWSLAAYLALAVAAAVALGRRNWRAGRLTPHRIRRGAATAAPHR